MQERDLHYLSEVIRSGRSNAFGKATSYLETAVMSCDQSQIEFLCASIARSGRHALVHAADAATHGALSAITASREAPGGLRTAALAAALCAVDDSTAAEIAAIVLPQPCHEKELEVVAGRIGVAAAYTLACGSDRARHDAYRIARLAPIETIAAASLDVKVSHLNEAAAYSWAIAEAVTLAVDTAGADLDTVLTLSAAWQGTLGELLAATDVVRI